MTVVLQGGAGDDVLRGGRADERIEGGAGNDSLYGGKGRNQLFGGEGVDLAVYESSLARYRIEQDPQSGLWRVLGYATDDQLDSIEALQFPGLRIELQDLARQLQPGADDQVFYAYAGRGQIDGGAGDDLLIVNTALDPFQAPLHWDAQGWALNQGGEPLRLAGIERIQFSDGAVLDLRSAEQGRIRRDGGAGDDELSGYAGADWLRGGAGRDVLKGGWGNDHLDGGAGEDLAVLPQPFGHYRFQQDGARWTLSSPLQTLVLDGIEAVDFDGQTVVLDDLLRSPGAGDDRLYALSGQHVFDGGAGQDRLVLSVPFAAAQALRHQGAGPWQLDLGGEPSLSLRDIESLEFSDCIVLPDGGEGGRALVLGGAGADRLWGHAGADHLQGGDGDDWLSAALGGADVLDGGAGNDVLQADIQPWQDSMVGIDELSAPMPPTPLPAPQQVLLRGGPGQDTVQLMRGFDAYRLSQTAEGEWQIESDTLQARLQDMEWLQFEPDSYVAWIDAPPPEPLRVRLDSGLLRGQGGTGDDALIGLGGVSDFDGGDGQDLLLLSAGRDELLRPLQREGQVWLLPLAGGSLRLQGIERLRFADGEFELLPDGRLRKQGSAHDDWLAGSAAHDWLQAGAGDDRLLLSDGEDQLDGGAGQDSLVLFERVSAYALRFDAALGQWAIEHAGGVSWLTSIERLLFSGQHLNLADLNAPADAPTREHYLFRGVERVQGGSGLDTLHLDGPLGQSVLEIQQLPGGARQLKIDGRSVTLTGVERLAFVDLTVDLNEPALRQPSQHQSGWGNDALLGNDLGYALWGEGGDDTLEGRGGDDTLYGGKGRDTALYRGLRSEYEIEPGEQSGQFRVRDLVPGRDGQDQLFDIERLRFADGELDLTVPLVGLAPAAEPDPGF